MDQQEPIIVFQVQCSKNDQATIRNNFREQEDPLQPFHPNPLSTSPTIINLIPRQHHLHLQADSIITLPLLFTVHTNHSSQAQIRTPIDLICVVDNSASMCESNKLKLVRKSLRYLLKILNENDRICIITYSKNSKIRTSFMRNSIENKPKIKKIIKSLNTANSTNIHAGISDAFWMLKNRKQNNALTSIFLLSDGLDDNPNQVSQKIRDEYISQQMNEQDFNIFTFGYGNDCDPKLLVEISQLKNGEYYLVKEFKNICEYFILAVAGLINVIQEQAELNIEWINQKDLLIRLHDANNEWVHKNPHQITQQLGYVLAGDKKEVMCELVLENQGDKDLEGTLQLNGTLISKLTQENKVAEFTTSCQIYFENRKHYFEQNLNDINQNVEVNYLRNKGAQIIGQACNFADQMKFDQANCLLDQFIEEIDKSSLHSHPQLSQIKNDVEKSKSLCKPCVFQELGLAYMIRKERSHMKRKGSISNSQDWNQGQEEIMDDYKQGKLQLSDDSCPSKGGSDAESPLEQGKGFSDDEENEEDEEVLESSLAQKILNQEKKNIKKFY